mmetsp:Transcript_82362/g.266709  ORF Transcript_82362/g.266709 Transcript_82362/m.266709 type:complete len:584 (-) Transcript_82362:272-2023(-)
MADLPFGRTRRGSLSPDTKAKPIPSQLGNRSPDLQAFLVQPSWSQQSTPETEVQQSWSVSPSSSHWTLLKLLTKSDSVWGSSPCPPDFLDYRQKNLQWRSGQAQGARGEVTDVESASRQKGLLSISARDAGFGRCSSWPIYPELEDARQLWVLSADLEYELHAKYPDIWKRLQTQAGRLLQMAILVLVVLTYAACPLTVSWAKVVGSDGSVPIKGRPFKESSVIVVSWALLASFGMLFSLATGGRPALRQCFDRRAILTFAPAGIGWALADVCEVFALAKIDPATYGVISQARLLGSAAACWAIRGVRQSQLQWGILGALSLVCMAYCVVPDDPIHNKTRLFKWHVAQAELKMSWLQPPSSAMAVDPDAGSLDQVVGVTMALLKVTLSVVSGVYGESCFKVAGQHVKPPELHVQMVQISFSSMLAALVGYCIICLVQGESILEFFSGPDGEWDARTLAVSVVYCWREWICSLCVKRFDALVKNICNAVALVVTYGWTVMASGEKPFSALKVLLLLAVVAEVVNYSATRRSPRTVASAAQPPAQPLQDEGQAKSKAFLDIPMTEYTALRRTSRHQSWEMNAKSS